MIHIAGRKKYIKFYSCQGDEEFEDLLSVQSRIKSS